MNEESYLIRSSGGSDANPPASKAENPSTATNKIRRRNRLITSCLECRRRKLKCDKLQPCSNCNKSGRRDCVFLAPSLDSASQLKLTQLKEKVGTLEHLLEKDVAQKERTALDGYENSYDNATVHVENEDDGHLPADEAELEPTPMAMQDAVYDDDADDDLMDLGIQMGKMRITERLGGFFRPRMSEELDATLQDSRKDRRSPEERAASKPIGYYRSSIAPPDYVAPSSSFFFAMSSTQSSLIDFLPSKGAADRLMEQYYKACHPINKILHKQSFDISYALFWEQVAINMEPTGSLQAIVFAALFNAVISMDENDILQEFGVAKSGLISNFQLGTETALAQANFLRSTKVETLQAFVLYLIPQCRDVVSRAHSALTGTAIRIAECMGLHRDGELYGIGPVETHVRRLIWHNLGFLDLRTCEVHGPRPQIRKDSFDTKLPLNVDEADLLAPIAPVKSRQSWTDMTITVIRSECMEMRRTLWFDRPRIEKKQISLTSVLAKIETFHKKMREKYSFLDENIPIQKYAIILLKIVHYGMHIGILHRYHNSVSVAMPSRFKSMIIESGTRQLEFSIQLETAPEFRQWAWYMGAYHQWHTALLLLVEIWTHPDRKEADRIWACLDYVCNCSPGLSRDEKARQILAELRDKSAVFQSRRKMKIPMGLANRLGAVQPRRASDDRADFNESVSPTSISDQGFSPLSESSSNHQQIEPTAREMRQMSMSYSGIANGEILVNSNASPGPPLSDRSSRPSINASPMPQTRHDTSPPTTIGDAGTGSSKDDELMADINWDEWDALFPPTENDGISLPEIPNLEQTPASFNYEYPFSLDQLGQK